MSLRLPLEQIRGVLASAPLIPRFNLTGSGDGTIPIAGHAVTLPGRITMQVINAGVVNPAELHRILTQPLWPASAMVHLGAQDTTQVMFRLDARAPRVRRRQLELERGFRADG